MNETLNKNLTLIQEVATKALEEHKNSTERFSGINYPDLFVLDVWVKYSLGDSREYYGITIGECSSRAGDLYQYMKEYLLEHLPDDLGCYVDVEFV